MAVGLHTVAQDCPGASVDASTLLAGTPIVNHRPSTSPAGKGASPSTSGHRTGVDPSAFHVRPLTEPDARRIASWRYPPPYDFYDLPEEAWADLLGLGPDFQAVDLAPGTVLPGSQRRSPGRLRWLPDVGRRAIGRAGRGAPSRSVPASGLAGFVCFGAEAQVSGARDAGLYVADALDIGLGLRPDLTGHGLGDAFVAACLDHARRTRHPRSLRLAVAEFNQRAIRVYERAGFRTLGSCESPVRGRSVQFHVMIAD